MRELVVIMVLIISAVGIGTGVKELNTRLFNFEAGRISEANRENKERTDAEIAAETARIQAAIEEKQKSDQNPELSDKSL